MESCGADCIVCQVTIPGLKSGKGVGRALSYGPGRPKIVDCDLGGSVTCDRTSLVEPGYAGPLMETTHLKLGWGRDSLGCHSAEAFMIMEPGMSKIGRSDVPFLAQRLKLL